MKLLTLRAELTVIKSKKTALEVIKEIKRQNTSLVIPLDKTNLVLDTEHLKENQISVKYLSDLYDKNNMFALNMVHTLEEAADILWKNRLHYNNKWRD